MNRTSSRLDFGIDWPEHTGSETVESAPAKPAAQARANKQAKIGKGQ